jgi:mannose-6-phosphate isomerase class I
MKKGISLEEYKQACVLINETMKQWSQEIISGQLSLDEAKIRAKEFIQKVNPWQYVNVMDVKKGQLVDLSMGGVHHSWEEDKANHPLGNVVYEVQRDVMDPQCTIRSFDQGKFKSDGSIREIHIEDYFKYLDADPAANDINNLKRERVGNSLLKTPYYSMNIIECENAYNGKTNGAFCHLFVHQGNATITTTEGSVHITQGHSCFVPAAAESYTITTGIKTVLLQSFI